jgi:hypothetical protein
LPWAEVSACSRRPKPLIGDNHKETGARYYERDTIDDNDTAPLHAILQNLRSNVLLGDLGLSHLSESSNYSLTTLSPLEQCILAIIWEITEDKSHLSRLSLLNGSSEGLLENTVIVLRAAAVYQAKLEPVIYHPSISILSKMMTEGILGSSSIDCPVTYLSSWNPWAQACKVLWGVCRILTQKLHTIPSAQRRQNHFVFKGFADPVHRPVISRVIPQKGKFLRQNWLTWMAVCILQPRNSEFCQEINACYRRSESDRPITVVKIVPSFSRTAIHTEFWRLRPSDERLAAGFPRVIGDWGLQSGQNASAASPNGSGL